VPDASSRAGFDKQRTRGGLLSRGALLLLPPPPLLLDDAGAQPASATTNSKSVSEPRRFMRSFYRGIRYI
jgi:hypothetical protein